MVDESAKHFLDVGAVLSLVAVFFNWLPHATALVLFTYACIRVYETKTVQGLIHRKRQS